MQFERLKVNPLSIMSGVFMLVAPFRTWMTLSAFGYVSGSNLWQITASETNFPIDRNIPSVALYSGILMIIAGLVTIGWTRIGLPISAVSLSLFGLESYSSFGVFSGPIPVSILPGIGFYLGLSGMVLGLAALRAEGIPFANVIDNFKTKISLGRVGTLVTSVFLSADAWNHWSSGEFSGFLGTTLLEGAIHRAFFLGVGLLLVLFVTNSLRFVDRIGGALVLATFCGLILDAAYHVVTGSIVEFVGHDSTEILLHAVTYYGAVTVVIGRFLLKR
ncbi:MAG TPA: hypothetical protein VE955_03795 [Candidatus Dormibacteraeota bacterium]|jgi:hypothetical protein|nr:hypothetical protein [Candidatus Dormibacteraeota bacterium]